MSGNVRQGKVWQAAEVVVEIPLYRSYNISVSDAWLRSIDGDSNVEDNEDENETEPVNSDAKELY